MTTCAEPIVNLRKSRPELSRQGAPSTEPVAKYIFAALIPAFEKINDAEDSSERRDHPQFGR